MPPKTSKKSAAATPKNTATVGTLWQWYDWNDSKDWIDFAQADSQLFEAKFVAATEAGTSLKFTLAKELSFNKKHGTTYTFDLSGSKGGVRTQTNEESGTVQKLRRLVDGQEFYKLPVDPKKRDRGDSDDDNDGGNNSDAKAKSPSAREGTPHAVGGEGDDDNEKSEEGKEGGENEGSDVCVSQQASTEEEEEAEGEDNAPEESEPGDCNLSRSDVNCDVGNGDDVPDGYGTSPLAVVEDTSCSQQEKLDGLLTGRRAIRYADCLRYINNPAPTFAVKNLESATLRCATERTPVVMSSDDEDEENNGDDEEAEEADFCLAEAEEQAEEQAEDQAEDQADDEAAEGDGEEEEAEEEEGEKKSLAMTFDIPPWPTALTVPDPQPMPPTLQVTLDSLSSQLREKPEWWRKVNDETIVAKWKAEVLAHAAKQAKEHNDQPNRWGPRRKASYYMSGAGFDVVVQELQWMARRAFQIPPRGPSIHVGEDKTDDAVTVTAAPAAATGVWHVDGAISARVRAGLLERLEWLQAAVAEEDEGDGAVGIDYHPNSHRQVENYIHPSLHCAYFGSLWTKLLCGDTAVKASCPIDSWQKSEPVNVETFVTARGGKAKDKDEGKATDNTTTEKAELREKKEQAATHTGAVAGRQHWIPLHDSALVSHHPHALRILQPEKNSTSTDRWNHHSTDLRFGNYPDDFVRCHPLDDMEAADFFNRNTEFSRRFQWLPSQYDVDLGTGKVTIRSYIPGVDPTEHQGLYAGLAKVFEAAVPLVERVLRDTELNYERPLQLGPHSNKTKKGEKKKKKTTAVDAGGGDPRFIAYASSKILLKDTRVREVLMQSTAGDTSARARKEFVPPKPVEEIPTPVSLRGMSLQVITKAAKIHLKPDPDAAAKRERAKRRAAMAQAQANNHWHRQHEDDDEEDGNQELEVGQNHKQQDGKVDSDVDTSSYAGGSWHIEGMRNENILATVIFYADQENVTESSLSFRKPISTGWLDHWLTVQDSIDLISWHFDIDEDVEAKVGKVPTSQGRLLVFPNTMQHCVSPFELKDPTKPGWRTVVVYFIVHPKCRIPSTALVPAQDITWQERAWIRILRQVFRNNHDVSWEVAGYLLCGPTKAQAQQLRLELMEERGKGSHGYGVGYRQDRFTAMVSRDDFDLCEH